MRDIRFYTHFTMNDGKKNQIPYFLAYSAVLLIAGGFLQSWTFPFTVGALYMSWLVEKFQLKEPKRLYK